MYNIIHDANGIKKTSSPDSREIYKKFKIYLPFGFDVKGSESMLKGQEQTIAIYKQLQGVALDLFKYIYPEPIFEFTTYETYDSVILMIRFTPLMKFNRPTTPPREVSFGEVYSDYGFESANTKMISTQDFIFDVNSYNVIESYDFGHDRIKSIRRESQNVSPSSLLRSHINELKNSPPSPPRRVIDTMQQGIYESKDFNVEDLIANDDESDEITDEFFNVIPIDTRFLESMNMTRSASSVVNVIWTVPTTDSALLKMSGRELVYAYLEQRLQETGGLDRFGNYIYQQFNQDFNANPVFLMDYRGVFGQNFVSGDMNYFGFREFEIKWNYLSVAYNTVSHLLASVDKTVLAEARKNSKDSAVTRVLDEAMRKNDDRTSQSSYIDKNGKVINPRRDAKIFTDESNAIKFDVTPPAGLSQEKQDEKMAMLLFPEKFGGKRANIIQQMEKEGWKTNSEKTRQTSRTNTKPSKNNAVRIADAKNEPLFKAALARYTKGGRDDVGLGVLDEKTIQNADTIIKLLAYAKKKDAELMGGFVSKINSVVASAYRENEHLYECNIVKPIDITILPGMIVESSNESRLAQSPRFKGYVTSISHSIDFNAATMKTAINMSRAASDDSSVYSKFGSE